MPVPFKAYDIRGVVPDQLDEALAERIGRATATFLDAGRMVVGRDMRDSGVGLSQALIRGIASTGCDVIDIGVVSSPMQYFAVGHLEADGGVMVTASHNPAEYNGFKISGDNVVPIGGDSGLAEIEAMVRGDLPEASGDGDVDEEDIKPAYREKLVSLITAAESGTRRLKVAVDCGNGMGGLEVQHVLEHLPIDIVGLYLEPDGTFPNHEANPLQPANMRDLQAAVLREGCDIGIAFDGDADRACFCDEQGRIIGNDLITAVLAQVLVPLEPGCAVLYDLRSSRVVSETIRSLGGMPVRERVGHAFMKATLRRHMGPFGGELSGHFYFRDLWFTDSGAYAAGLVLALLSKSDRPLSEIVAPLRQYPTTGEVNFHVEDKDALIEEIARTFADGRQDRLDGITVEYSDWWCNVRKSNTEPLLRLVLEADDEETFAAAKARVMAVLGEPIAE